MPLPVVLTGMCQCSFGMMPTPLMILPKTVMMTFLPAGTAKEHLPILNILPFGMCSCLGNPTVAAATAAALGVLTPMPCVPMTTSPWIPLRPTITVLNQPVLLNPSIAMCNWGGAITITFPGVTLVTVN